ncbi:hypothetical protein CRG98_042792 [Punica granatum]|uniref:Uncharacterized protein n=1 Tax=Punica granatum TaxID=22663 RepID=A0A2I0HZ13_PUNGR|nr:hypothetical protein CRG98_042792 [Punica granatum]
MAPSKSRSYTIIISKVQQELDESEFGLHGELEVPLLQFIIIGVGHEIQQELGESVDLHEENVITSDSVANLASFEREEGSKSEEAEIRDRKCRESVCGGRKRKRSRSQRRRRCDRGGGRGRSGAHPMALRSESESAVGRSRRRQRKIR